jgi:hypothetical protein
LQAKSHKEAAQSEETQRISVRVVEALPEKLDSREALGLDARRRARAVGYSAGT